LMAGADGQALHQCLADDALDEAEAAAQIGQYPRWRRWVDAGWLPGGPGEDTKRRADVWADRSPVRADPFRSHICAGNRSGGSRLSIWVRPLGCLFPLFSVSANAFGCGVLT
jgi:hypothetical protein